MRLRTVLALSLAICLLLGAGAPAYAGQFMPGTNHNINAVAKPQGNFVVHLTSGDVPATQATVHILETVCEKGVGIVLTAPRTAIDRGEMLVEHDGDAYLIPIAPHQLYFCWVLSEWPEPWPFTEVFIDEEQTMSLAVEWKADLGYADLEPDDVVEALHEGDVTFTYYYEDAVVLQGR